MQKRLHAIASVCAVVALSGCGGGGGGGGGGGAAVPISPAPAPAPAPAGRISGTFATGLAVAGNVELLAANGTVRSVQADGRGRFEASVEGLEAPYLLRGKLPSGQYLYAAAASAPASAATTTSNINQLTQLAVARISPSGDPGKLWALPAAERSARIVSSYAAALGPVAQAVSPVAAALELSADSGFATQPFEADGTGIDALLDNLKVEPFASDDGMVYSLAAARTPTLRSLWSSSTDAVPAVEISALEPPRNFGAVRVAIDASYEGLRTGAAQFDPAKVNAAEVARLSQEMLAESQQPEPSLERLNSLFRQLLGALGFPEALVGAIVRQLNGDNPSEALELIASFFGPDGQKALDDVKNMQVQLDSVNVRDGVATYRLVVGGQTYFQIWLLSSGNAATGRTTQPDRSQCLVSRYTGPTEYRITNEMLIDRSEYFNNCSFPINYATCIWRAGNTGPEHSGCGSATETGRVEPQVSTGLRDVRYGPLGESRAFAACAAPARPVFRGEGPSNQPALPYVLQWRCEG